MKSSRPSAASLARNWSPRKETSVTLAGKRFAQLAAAAPSRHLLRPHDERHRAGGGHRRGEDAFAAAPR